MLTTKQRAFLKKKAHSLDAMVRIGKEGYSENTMQGITDVIKSRELIKVKILQNCETDKYEIGEKIALGTESEVVGIIGRTIIIYKENKENPMMSLELKKV